MNVKTVAWKFARRYGSGLSFVEPEAPKGLTDDEFTEPQALVLRSDYESIESRLQQAQTRIDALISVIATDESDAILDKAEARAQQAEQALRELVLQQDRNGGVEDEAWAAARAIVEKP